MMIKEILTVIDGNQFKFKKLSAINALKFQQSLLNKLNVKELDLNIESTEGLINIFISILKGFDPDELINTITYLFEISESRVQEKNGEWGMIIIDKVFENNFNGVFALIFKIIEANYNDFFSKMQSNLITEK